MLKIRDEVDLKELEKYGLYKEEVHFGSVYTDKNIEVIEKQRTHIEDIRKIETWDYLECTDLDKYNDTLYDLIKDGLVEKVKE